AAAAQRGLLHGRQWYGRTRGRDAAARRPQERARARSEQEERRLPEGDLPLPHAGGLLSPEERRERRRHAFPGEWRTNFGRVRRGRDASREPPARNALERARATRAARVDGAGLRVKLSRGEAGA